MKKLLPLSLFLISASSFAHVEAGTYTGKTATGSACTMVSNGTTYLGGMKHPLNERVSLTVDDLTVDVRHPPMMSETAGTVGFNHDRFEGFAGIPGGGMAIIIEMTHNPGEEGFPSKLVILRDNWKNPAANTRSECMLDH